MEISKLMGEFKKQEGLTVLSLQRWKEIVISRMIGLRVRFKRGVYP